ncbi:cyclic nucleotide-binding domain-containing protein [Hymenobacter norwichensis]|uniref:cyclic nucleotide-binding domain-containing protein n=1 Tax=Hymenobacter norwichensis TaxID=223903 RepID=UPI00146BEDAF|nr:cyclic nucleotide-binding domain-containing protein [Hymenobacter norwichensis]
MNKITAGWSAVYGMLGVPWWGLLAGAGVLVIGGLLWLWHLGRSRQAHANSVPEAMMPTPVSVGQSNELRPAGTAPELPGPAVLAQLITTLHHKETSLTATNNLVVLGEAVLPVLKEHLLAVTDEVLAERLAQVCARLSGPAARQALLAVIRGRNLPGRAAALRALSSFSVVPADAPLFQRVMEEEMRLAQQLLHSLPDATTDLQQALHYELHRSLQRVFGLLLQLYDPNPILEVQRSVAHFASEWPASQWAALENLLPRPLYQGVYALLGGNHIRHQAQVFDNLLGPFVPTETVQTLILRRGTEAFSTWTIHVALRQWHPAPATVALLYPALLHSNQLIREGAWEVLGRLPVQRPAAYDQLLLDHPDVAALLAATLDPLAAEVSARERVLLLKATPLFSETPENVLADIVSAVREVVFQPQQEIFAKGALESSLYILKQGTVDIFDGFQVLASFGPGDFFGELALLDAEPRSATAIARTHTVALRLDQEEFYNVLATHPKVLHPLIKALCQRLRRQNEEAQLLAS